jgi:hypothetical protein
MSQHPTTTVLSTPAHNQLDSVLRLALLTATTMATACTAVYQPGTGQPPEVASSTLNGPVPLYGPGQGGVGGPGGSLAMPPPGIDGTLPTPAGTVGRNGTYAGYADVMSTGGGMCLNDRTVTNFNVQGNTVDFGEFHGTIYPNGGLQMVNGNTWITGGFQGATFRGQITAGGPMGCTFSLELERVGV